MKLVICVVIGVLSFLSLSSAESENIEPVDNPDIPTLIGYSKGFIVVQFGESAGQINPQKNREGVVLTGIRSLDIIAEKYRITDIKPQFPGAKPIMFEGRIVDLSRDYIIQFY